MSGESDPSLMQSNVKCVGNSLLNRRLSSSAEETGAEITGAGLLTCVGGTEALTGAVTTVEGILEGNLAGGSGGGNSTFVLGAVGIGGST